MSNKRTNYMPILDDDDDDNDNDENSSVDMHMKYSFSRYNKVCKDNYDFHEFTPSISQFAQVVWKDSNFLGMGKTTAAKGGLLCTYIVARYSPPATKEGFGENVPIGTFSTERFCTEKCLTNRADAPLKNKGIFYQVNCNVNVNKISRLTKNLPEVHKVMKSNKLDICHYLLEKGHTICFTS